MNEHIGIDLMHEININVMQVYDIDNLILDVSDKYILITEQLDKNDKEDKEETQLNYIMCNNIKRVLIDVPETAMTVSSSDKYGKIFIPQHTRPSTVDKLIHYGLDKIIDEYCSGDSIYDLGRKVGVAAQAIERLLIVNGFELVRYGKRESTGKGKSIKCSPKKQRCNLTQLINAYGLDRLKQEYCDGATMNELASRLGITLTALKGWFQANGITKQFNKELRENIPLDNLDIDADRYNHNIINRLVALEEYTDNFSRDCYYCGYRERSCSRCWYTMVHNKNRKGTLTTCEHFVDMRKLRDDKQ